MTDATPLILNSADTLMEKISQSQTPNQFPGIDYPESFAFEDLLAYANDDAIQERLRLREDAAEALRDPNADPSERADPYPEWRSHVESTVRSLYRLHAALDAPLREIFDAMEESDANWMAERVIGQFEPTLVPSCARVLRTYLLTRDRLGMGPTIAAVLQLTKPQSFLRVVSTFEGLFQGHSEDQAQTAQQAQPQPVQN